MILIFRWLATIMLAVVIGKFVSKIKLPSILGWLIAGMVLGPYAGNLLPQTLIDMEWYGILIHYLCCWIDDCNRAGLEQNKEIWKSPYDYYIILILGNFYSGIYCICNYFCSDGYSHIPCIHFWRNRFSNCSSSSTLR